MFSMLIFVCSTRSSAPAQWPGRRRLAGADDAPRRRLRARPVAGRQRQRAQHHRTARPGLFTQSFAFFIAAGAPLHLPGAPFLLASLLLAAALLVAWRVTRPR
jgi:hypothetical protein